jgi:cell division protein FtsL
MGKIYHNSMDCLTYVFILFVAFVSCVVESCKCKKQQYIHDIETGIDSQSNEVCSSVLNDNSSWELLNLGSNI